MAAEKPLHEALKEADLKGLEEIRWYNIRFKVHPVELAVDEPLNIDRAIKQETEFTPPFNS